MTRDDVLRLLWENGDGYVSGAELARRLGISRTAVWKAVDRLRQDGWQVESGTNRGYRLLSGGDDLTEAGVRRYLRREGLELRVFPEIGSTNTALKELASRGAPEGLVLLAERQTEGRGRLGRSFFSPPGSGLYLSLLLRPNAPASAVTGLTAAAAVAVAETLEELGARDASIKWVNDVYVNGRKVCGILNEAALDLESGTLSYVVVGIGVNVRAPEGDFPPELQGIAGAAFGPESVPELRCRLAAGILDRLLDFYGKLTEKPFYESYVNRSLVLGQPLNILAPGRDPVPCTGMAIQPDFALLVRLEDGSLRRLDSGEVSVRVRSAPEPETGAVDTAGRA